MKVLLWLRLSEGLLWLRLSEGLLGLRLLLLSNSLFLSFLFNLLIYDLFLQLFFPVDSLLDLLKKTKLLIRCRGCGLSLWLLLLELLLLSLLLLRKLLWSGLLPRLLSKVLVLEVVKVSRR